jgi:hypothetical protein
MPDTEVETEQIKSQRVPRKAKETIEKSLNFQRFVLLVLIVAVASVLFAVIKDAPTKSVQPSIKKSNHSLNSMISKSSTTTTVSVSPAPVTVLVANGTSIPLAASDWSKYLNQELGYQVLPAVDSTTPASSSALYYQPGMQKAAQQLAGTIGLSSTEIFAMPQSPPVSNLNGADLLLVLGPALASKASSLP